MTGPTGPQPRPLRIAVWGINYAPEWTGIAPCNTALCQYLRAEGHDVRMVTSFPYYPAWKKRAEDRGRLFRLDLVDGVPVYRCWHYVPAKVTILKRMAHEGTFVAASFLRQLFLRRPDLLVVVSPPLLLGAAAWLLGLFKRCPFVFHVQDLQPDAAASLGMVRAGVFIRLLYRLEAFAYSKAALVGGIGPGMIQALAAKGVPPAKLICFPNGVRLPGPSELPPVGRFRERLGLNHREFLAVYSGNLGVKQGLEILVEAGPHVRDPRVRIIICGDGSDRARLAARLAKSGASNVLMIPLQEEQAYREMLRDADLCLITQQPGTGQFFLPSKLLGALALAKPVLSVADESSDLVQAMRAGGFGFNILPGRPAELAVALDDLAAQGDKLAAWGEAGRRYVGQFDFEVVHRRFEEAVLRVAGSRGPAQ